MEPNLQGWLDAHPYLESIARFEQLVADAAAAIPAPTVRTPSWTESAEELARGIPLLRSAEHPIDVAAPAAEVLARLAERLAQAPLPEKLAAQLHELSHVVRRSPEDRARIVAWALAGSPADRAPAHAGLAAFLAWTALRLVLRPVIAAFGASRCKERWSRGTCPTCGAQPAMSRLVTDGAVRQRHLACACCGTRWRYKRIGCPFCGNEAPERLEVLEVGGEAGFRLDACRECKGYTKTWVGEGDGALFLADWPTLHLDLLAKEQGLARLGASLYEL